MTGSLDLTRRKALAAGVAVTFLARQAFAASEGDLAQRKLVVVICRGGMDGLSVSPPVGDPGYAALRGDIAIAGFDQPNGALKLDGAFGLHPKLAAVHAMALKGQARIAPAIATPDRARSHFEAQDVLESGASSVYGQESGWLNRAIEALAPARKVEALSVGAQAPLILRGKLQAASWSPGGLKERDSRLPAVLADLYAGDPLLGPALASGLETEAMATVAMAPSAASAAGMAASGVAPTAPTGPAPPLQGPEAVAAAARSLGATLARFMLEPNGPQVAAVSIEGFDTHANQGAAEGQLANHLSYLDATLDGLSSGLGDEWRNTVVLVATEFGRTARVNGTRGTDHGTASTALLLGGGLKRGGIVGDWPTLQQARLFENRDTAPTVDMRSLFKGVLADQLGVDRQALDTTVFPDSGTVEPMRGLLA